MQVIGLDLAGSPKRRTGACALTPELRCELAVLGTDREVLEFTTSRSPALVAIDAPLFLPRGRPTLAHRSGPHFRACDLELRRRRIPFFPITLGPMRLLTRRGMRIAAGLQELGVPVHECFPGASQDLLGIPRKRADLPGLRAGLLAAGLTGDIARAGLTHDELDAATAALTALLFLQGRGEAIGDPSEGLMILPAGPRRAPPAGTSNDRAPTSPPIRPG